VDHEDAVEAVFGQPGIVGRAEADRDVVEPFAQHAARIDVVGAETLVKADPGSAVYAALLGAKENGLSEREVANVIAASAEGYAFPTNLDRDPPIGGLAPQTQQQLMAKALAENWETDVFAAALKKHSWRRLT